MLSYKQVICMILFVLLIQNICFGDSSKPSDKEMKGLLFNIIGSDFQKGNAAGGYGYGNYLYDLIKIDNIKIMHSWSRVTNNENHAFAIISADITVKVKIIKTSKEIVKTEKSTNTYRFMMKGGKWCGDILVRRYKST